MATRTIVTSQPDVACDVCERRLLRGEQPDVFLAGGRRRTVCELCAPRATHEGWLREADRHSVSLPPSRARRGRNLFDRLRQMREPIEDRPAGAGALAAGPATGAAYELQAEEDEEPYEFLGGFPGVAEESAPLSVEDRSEIGQPALTGGDLKVERALKVFNVGEHPRRLAGVARSLGAPAVSVRPVDEAGSVVAIVVAWELCWYRYEVDLGDEAAGARAVAQGTELDELAGEDRLANVAADELGALSLSVA
jgi:hypothetical protein